MPLIQKKNDLRIYDSVLGKVLKGSRFRGQTLYWFEELYKEDKLNGKI